MGTNNEHLKRLKNRYLIGKISQNKFNSLMFRLKYTPEQIKQAVLNGHKISTELENETESTLFNIRQLRFNSQKTKSVRHYLWSIRSFENSQKYRNLIFKD